ncbi:MAG TPA: trypsin-like serine protease, partial [Polyangiaceae bacterium]
MTTRPRLQGLSGVIALHLLAGCGDGAAGVEDPVARERSPVINGTIVPAGNSGHVLLLGPPNKMGLSNGCSGALVSNDWAVTAKHCVDDPGDTIPPSNLRVVMGGDATRASEVLHFPDDDFALIRLERPLFMNGSQSGFFRRFFWGSKWELRGFTLRCSGYGMFDFVNDPDDNLRQADLVAAVSSTWGDLLAVRNAAGQQMYEGDSGAACLLLAPRSDVIAGVVWGGWLGSSDTGLMEVETYRDWVGVSRAEHELVAAHSDKCLHVSSAGLQQQTCNGSRQQRFRLVPTYWGKHQIRAADSGACLTLPAPGSAADGVRYSLETCNVES